jgi:hypothetical protein
MVLLASVDVDGLSPEQCCKAFSVGPGPMSGRPSLPGSDSHQPRVGCLKGYIQNDVQDLLKAFIWRYSKVRTATYIHKSAELSCKLLPLCREGSYLCSITAGANSVNHLIREYNNLPIDASDEGIHF